MSGGARELVSVVLCTTGRRPSLDACLTSLSVLDDECHEVLVIENSPTPQLSADALASWGARWVHEPRQGLDVARNRGVAEAAGEIVAFVDDDCVVDPAWLAGYRRVFGDPSVGFATGRVRPVSLERWSEQLFERWFSFDRGDRELSFTGSEPLRGLRVIGQQVGTGCNMAFRRSVIVEAGGFDEALDMGTLIGGGGDLDMFTRLLRAGIRATYAPDALMSHSHRSSMRELRWQFFGYGLSQGALAMKAIVGGDASLRAEALDVWRHRTGSLAGYMGMRLRGRAIFPGQLLLPELAGILLGPFAYPIARLQALGRRARAR